MLFNSHLFIFIFLPLTLAGWYLLNKFRLFKFAGFFLICMSLWFYGYFNPAYLLLILSSMGLNYIVSLLMSRFAKAKTVLFLIGLCGNIGILGYFKYYDFFVENINAVFGSSIAVKHILLPLGISFFTLQQISYIIDRFWDMAPHYKLLDYVGYITFFPQLIAGPIVFHNELVPQLQDIEKRHFNPESFRDGVTLFILGLIKKVIIADFFARPVNYGFEYIIYLDTMSAWYVALSYTFELYFDFSGYCDMACGIGKMFNIELPANFNSPYKAHSVSEYWKRWHITLTRFFTQYIYIPFSMHGVRAGKKKLYSVLAPLLVFFVSGFWHGASWTFIIWGIIYGVAVLWSQRKKFKLKKGFVAWLCTFVFTVFTQIIFRCETLSNMRMMLKAMFVPSFNAFVRDIGSTLTAEPIFNILLEKVFKFHGHFLYAMYAVCLTLCFILAGILLHGKNASQILAAQKEKGYTTAFTLGLGILFAWCLISMTGVSTFLYFNF